MNLLPVQCRMARAALGWSLGDLAAAAKVGVDTVTRFERGDPLRERTVEAIQRALEEAGMTFIPENGGGPGVRLSKPINVPVEPARTLKAVPHKPLRKKPPQR